MPAFEVRKIGDATLYLGDCLDVIEHIDQVDAVITDPPYSANTHKMAKTNKGNGKGKKLVNFASVNDDWFASLMNALLGKTSGWVIATCDYKHAALMYEDKRFVRLGAWVKPNPMPQISADRPGQGFETILIMHSGYSPKKWNRGGGSGVWTFPVHSGSLVATQKPIGLLRALVSDFTQPGETVLDCCMGSGTTGVAALQQGRKFVGIERDREHFEIACARIEQAQQQADMFQPKAKQPEISPCLDMFP